VPSLLSIDVCAALLAHPFSIEIIAALCETFSYNSVGI
jgi:hypothetical protein